jgi:hypothetical protein
MVRKLLILAWLVVLQACATSQPRSFMLGDFLNAKELPYDSPPQVICRIDNHRFVTLERYRDCHHGEAFYNDTKANIHRKIGTGRFENFQGELINADPSDRNVVLPLAYPPHTVCGDRGCVANLWYSTDGGATFHLLTYMEHSFNPFEDSKRYTIAVTGNTVYVARARQYDSYVVAYPLVPGFDYNGKHPLPEGARIKFDSVMPSGLRSPSGQDRLSCDASIKPTNPDAPLPPTF